MNKDFITFLSSTNRDEGSICSKIWNTKSSTILETQSGWKFGCEYTWCCCILSVGATRCSKNGKDFLRFLIRLESDIAHTIGVISDGSYYIDHIIWPIWTISFGENILNLAFIANRKFTDIGTNFDNFTADIATRGVW